MKVAVLGGGVIGVATAYYLAKGGASVTLVDRQPGPALETSFANGGQISANHVTPWATPSTPLKALRWLGRGRRAVAHPSSLGPGTGCLVASLPRQLHAPTIAHQHSARAQASALQPRSARRLASFYRHPVRPARARHSAHLPQPTRLRGSAAGHRVDDRPGMRAADSFGGRVHRSRARFGLSKPPACRRHLQSRR